jgi:hypothetical protein
MHRYRANLICFVRVHLQVLLRAGTRTSTPFATGFVALSLEFHFADHLQVLQGCRTGGRCNGAGTASIYLLSMPQKVSQTSKSVVSSDTDSRNFGSSKT